MTHTRLTDLIWSLSTRNMLMGVFVGLFSCQFFWANDVRGYVWCAVWFVLACVFAAAAHRKEVEVERIVESRERE